MEGGGEGEGGEAVTLTVPTHAHDIWSEEEKLVLPQTRGTYPVVEQLRRGHAGTHANVGVMGRRGTPTTVQHHSRGVRDVHRSGLR